MPNKVVLITGMQRCGTSVFSQFCSEYLQYDMGTDFWHGDINGGLESPDICFAYRDELGDKDFPFSDFEDSVKRSAEDYIPLSEVGLKYSILKFSYLLMNPKFVDIWLRHRATNDDRFIVLMREPEKVLKSKAKNKERVRRFGKDSEWLNYGADQLRINFFNSLLKLLSASKKIKLLKFPEFLLDYNIVYEALHDFGGLDIEYDPSLWLDLVDMDKVSFR